MKEPVRTQKPQPGYSPKPAPRVLSAEDPEESPSPSPSYPPISPKMNLAAPAAKRLAGR